MAICKQCDAHVDPEKCFVCDAQITASNIAARSSGDSLALSTGSTAAESEAAELARHLGAVAEHCNIIVPWVLAIGTAPPGVIESAEEMARYLNQVRP